MELSRNINYLNKDFNSIKSQLQQYAKTYFSETYNDFSESSPGTMFMELQSYVGDILSFYTDTQIQENFIQYANQASTVYDLAYLLGYKPKVTGLASTIVDFYQLLPAKYSSGSYSPDWGYTISIKPFTNLGSSEGVNFIMENNLDFSISSSYDPTEVSIGQINSNGDPVYYLLKKSRKVVSGNIVEKTFSFGDYQEFPTIELADNNVAQIIEARDSENNLWYEVDYLGQDLIYSDTPSSGSNDVPYILNTSRVQRRFTNRFLSPNIMQIQFGSGKPTDNDMSLLPTFEHVGKGITWDKTKLNTAFSPTNFIFTDNYGIAPSNTSITFKYISGGGITSNVNSKSINRITDINNVYFNNNNLDPVLKEFILNNLDLSNPQPSTGGRGGESIDEIKINSMTNFQSQMRSVTKDDYLIRSLSMPPQYGVISKVHAQKPLASQDKSTLDLYVLSQNYNGNLIISNSLLKNNLQTYLQQYRVLGDIINIKDAYIVNIGINFEILSLPNFNNSSILVNCITKLKEYFNLNKWQINQPIILRDLYILLDKIEGVQTVKRVEITNLVGEELGYSKYAYDIMGATFNNIIYPSLDPCIFEVKYPDQDIKGRISSI